MRYSANLCRLQDSNLQVRTYVHGTYYSLLSRKHFQDLAHERGLADMFMAGVLIHLSLSVLCFVHTTSSCSSLISASSNFLVSYCTRIDNGASK